MPDSSPVSSRGAAACTRQAEPAGTGSGGPPGHHRKGVSIMHRREAIAWVVTVCATTLRLSQARTLAFLVAAAMRVERISLANIGRAMLGQLQDARPRRPPLPQCLRRIAAAGAAIDDPTAGASDPSGRSGLRPHRAGPLLPEPGVQRYHPHPAEGLPAMLPPFCALLCGRQWCASPAVKSFKCGLGMGRWPGLFAEGGVSGRGITIRLGVGIIPATSGEHSLLFVRDHGGLPEGDASFGPEGLTFGAVSSAVSAACL